MGEMRTNTKPQTKKTNKVRVSLYLDSDVLNYYKSRSGGRGYQALINETLTKAMHTEDSLTLGERVDAVYGKFSFLQTSSEAFAARKQAEIELEG